MGRLAPIGFKQVSRTVAADTSALCHVKVNPLFPLAQTDAGAAITAATVEVAANSVILTVNGAAETVIGTYTGNSGGDGEVVFVDANIATVGNLIGALNGLAVGQTSVVRRWRAGLGDFRPQFAIGNGDGLVAVAANALLGFGVQGLAVLADSSGLASANLLSLALGTDRAVEGAGMSIPDLFEEDYTSTVAGVKTPVRNAGQRVASRPAQALFQVVVTDLQVAALFATTKVATFFDNAGNTLKTVALGAATSIPGSGDWTPENPFLVGPPGSPVFCEISGTGGFTDGSCTMTGYIRVGG